MTLYKLCWIVFLSGVGCAAVDGMSNKYIEYDACRHSENEVWLHDITPIGCSDECQARRGCISINFHAETHSCFLNIDTADDKSTCKDFIFTEKSEYNMALSPDCAAAQCHVTEVCVPRDTGVTCEVRECPNPSTVLNGHVLGNQRYIGARISVMCDYNYILFGPMSLTCEDKGVWRGGFAGKWTSPVCKRKCLDPPVILNGQSVGNQRYEGTSVSIACDTNYVLVGPTSLTCNSNGDWEAATAGGMTSPQCLRECVNPPVILNGQALGNQGYEGTNVSIVCDTNFVLYGPTSLTCSGNGDWVAVTAGGITSPQCLPCKINPLDAYNVHRVSATFQEAAATCETEGRHLVSFGCEEEYEFVVTLIQAHSLGTIHTGLNDLDLANHWTWYKSPDEANYIPWHLAEPNGSNEHCAVIRADYLLADYPCSVSLPFICEAD